MNTTLAAKNQIPLQSNSRRNFMRYLTAGATAVAVQGCGGGGAGQTASVASPSPAAPTSPTVPVVTPVAPVTPVVPTAPISVNPVMLAIPDIAFVEGTPSSFSVATYISADNVAAYAISLNAQPLPAGVTFNAATRSFEYDGKGSPAGTDGHVLTATGG